MQEEQKNKITYFHRHPKAGFSMGKVSQTYIQEIEKKWNVRQLYVPCYRATPANCFRNIAFIFLNRNKNGINHITGDIHYGILALIGCKSVLTVHDTCGMENKNPIKKFLLSLLWYKIPLFLATKIVCISEKTRNDLLKIINRKDISVIYNAVDPLFLPVQREFNKKTPIVLIIGTGWNKNLSNTVLALCNIACHLRIIGRLSSEQKILLEKNNIDYSNQCNLTDLEIVKEYNNCDIVSFCSVFEGFGMPPIEGNAVGRAVLTSKIEPMLEVVGDSDSALFIDPKDANSIREGFLTIIHDDLLRSKRIQNGYKNTERFNAKNIANKYVELYNILLY